MVRLKNGCQHIIFWKFTTEKTCAIVRAVKTNEKRNAPSCFALNKNCVDDAYIRRSVIYLSCRKLKLFEYKNILINTLALLRRFKCSPIWMKIRWSPRTNRCSRTVLIVEQVTTCLSLQIQSNILDAGQWYMKVLKWNMWA